MSSATVSDASQFAVAFRYQLRSYLRTWRFVGLVAFVAIISVAIFAVQLHRGSDVVTANYANASGYLSTYLGFLGDAIIITGAFLGGDALAVDLAGGPGYLMLTQPVRRRTLLAGRYAAAAVTGTGVGLVYYAFATVAVLYFYQSVPLALLGSFGCAVLYGLAVLAVAFFFSSFFRTPAVSIIVSLLILILLFPILTAVGDLLGSEPWYSLDYASGVITNVLSSNFQHETISHVMGARRGSSFAIYTYSPYLGEGLAIMAAYLAVFLGLTYLVYRYREVKG